MENKNIIVGYTFMYTVNNHETKIDDGIVECYIDLSIKSNTLAKGAGDYLVIRYVDKQDGHMYEIVRKYEEIFFSYEEILKYATSIKIDIV